MRCLFFYHPNGEVLGCVIILVFGHGFSGYYQGRSRLVYEHVVCLVHDCHVEYRGDEGLRPAGYAVPEIVESNLPGRGEYYGIGVLEPAFV